MGGPADASGAAPAPGVPAEAVAPPLSLAASALVDGIVIDGYSLVSSRRVSRTAFEYTYNADVSNWGTAIATITATLASTATNITVVQGSLNFGDVAQGATQPSLGTFVIRVDRSQSFDASALQWTVQATPLPPTTFALIDDALAGNVIDAETALVYKVYYEFHDSRLPAQYVGRDDGAREATAIQHAIENFGTLSQPTQDLLRPFLLPPEDPASWYRLHISPSAAKGPTILSVASQAAPMASANATATGCDPIYDTGSGTLIEAVDLTANGKVCIHHFASYAGDAATAASLSTAINDKIWPSLTALLGEPPLDANGLLQVYLVDHQNMANFYESPNGVALGLATICANSVPHLYLNRDNIKDINQTAAHELTHAITARYSRAKACGEAFWLGEATATWAEHFVYPGVQSEQPYAPNFLDTPSVSLEDRGNLHEYGAYLWFFYMTQGDFAGTGSGNSSYVKRVWTALASFDSLQAIDIAITEADGITKKWHDFALYNWNRDKKDNKPYRRYWQWDKLKHMARESPDGVPVAVKLGGAVVKTYKLPHTVRHLAATYYHFDLTGDKTIRRVRLLQPYSTSTAGNAKVQAIVKTDKGWQPAADWTGFKQKTLCRDKPDENFQELVIVISNSEIDNRSFVMTDDGSKTMLKVSALGCSNWKGFVTGKFSQENEFEINSATTDARDVTFEFKSETWLDDYDVQAFAVTAGNVTWTNSEKDLIFGCSGSFSGSYGLSNLTPGSETTDLNMGINGVPAYYIYSAVEDVADGGSWQRPEYEDTCPGPPPYAVPALLPGANAWFFTGDGKGNDPGIYDTAGGIFEGELRGSSVFVGSSQDTYTFSWGLQKNGTFPDPP